MAGGEAEPGGAATLCGAVLPACGGVPRTPAGAGGADGRSAAGIDPRERGGGRESGGTASEALAGFCSGGGRGGGRLYVLPRSVGEPMWRGQGSRELACAAAGVAGGEHSESR